MKKIALIVFLSSLFPLAFAQTKGVVTDSIVKKESQQKLSNKISDRLNKLNEVGKTTTSKALSAKDYLIISHDNDTTYVDTSLTIKKYYKLNYLRKDYFEILPFANTGQVFNQMSYNVPHQQLMPLFAARAKHYKYLEVNDIKYYHVPTPFSELYYRSVFTQGQITNSFFTVNTSKQLNLSIGYNALRSIGKYQHRLTSTGNFWLTGSYSTKNKRYVLQTHFIGQDLMAEENGGLKQAELDYFKTGDKEYLDRGVFSPNFQDANTMLNGKRYYLQHRFNILHQSAHTLGLKHIISLEDKYYRYEQITASPLFGDAFQGKQLRDVVKLEDFYNTLRLEYTNKLLGHFSINATNRNYNYGYNKALILDNAYITNRLKGDVIAIGTSYKNTIGRFKVKGNAGANISGDLDANFVEGNATINLTKDIKLSGVLHHSSRMPNYNALLYQSMYTNYNWENKFKTVNTQQLGFYLKSKKIVNASIDVFTINNYTYYGKVDTLEIIKPFQSDKPISYLKVKVAKEFRLKNVALDNTLMYQKVTDDNKVLNLPEVIARTALYYSNHVFKRAMFLQTGMSFSYFTKYFANSYNPVLAEFYVQNQEKIGDYPRLDVFVNGKIRNARIYFKAEHINSRLTGYKYLSSKNYPYRDFAIRVGVVWNFFM